MSEGIAAAPPLRSFVESLRSILASPSPEAERVLRVKDRLSQLLKEPGWLPASCRVADPGQYARHLLFEDPSQGFCLVSMVWGPGQNTAIHDHAGVWCVEGVYEGILQVIRYDLQGEAADTVRFLPGETIQAGVGACGALIPPSEYHQISNRTSATALSLHVYEKDLKVCHVFDPVDGDRYRRQRKEMRYHSVASVRV
jgi:3-mercaptopropionate dioxygenase